MSTRACIAYPSKSKKWEGVFSHWDGYPSGLGKDIWDILHEKFIGNKGKFGVMNSGDETNAIEAFIQIYIKGHLGGWSSFGRECYCHSPEFIMRDGKGKNIIDGKKGDPLFIEYVYILDAKKKEMIILTSKDYSDNPEYRIGERLDEEKAKAEKEIVGTNEWGAIVDYGHCVYGYQLLTVIDLLGKEPDWEKIENFVE